MIIAEKFIRSLVSIYEKHTVYTDGGMWNDEICNIIGLKYYLKSSMEKSLIPRFLTNYHNIFSYFNNFVSQIFHIISGFTFDLISDLVITSPNILSLTFF